VHKTTTPKLIKNHKYSAVLETIWKEVHENDGIVTIVFCGKRGKGKSLSMAEWARILDRNESDKPRFKASDIKLDPVEFLEGLVGNYPRGKVHCLDDAGLHMYKSDALTDMLKKVSKILQNIRYKHPIILMSLPHFEQLMKDARTMTDIYIEMYGIKKDLQLALGTVQILKISPFSGEVFRYTILQTDNKNNNKFGTLVKHWEPLPFGFNKPPQEFIKEYETIKKKKLNELNEKLVSSVKQSLGDEDGSNKAKRFTFGEAVEYCKIRIEQLKDSKGKISKGKILQLTDEKGRQLFGYNLAADLKRELHEQITHT